MRLAAVRTRYHLARSRARRLSDRGGCRAVPVERKFVVVPDDRRRHGDGVRDMGMVIYRACLGGFGTAANSLSTTRLIRQSGGIDFFLYFTISRTKSSQ